jgi:hypothetical protein
MMSTPYPRGGGLPSEIHGGALSLYVWGLYTRIELVSALSLGECGNHLFDNFSVLCGQG